MTEQPFEDYYEILEISPNANPETVERVFRFMAKRFHPDNSVSGDPDRFEKVVSAHRVLSDPEQRACFDVKHARQSVFEQQLAREIADDDGFDRDRRDRQRLLMLLYIKRRRDMKNPGLGNSELERVLNIPTELLDFHIWYLREKGWLLRTEAGLLGITVLGIDYVESTREPAATAAPRLTMRSQELDVRRNGASTAKSAG